MGLAVGNALEVKEAVATLRGEGPEDFMELCLTLGSLMLIAGGKTDSAEEARQMLKGVIADGSALNRLAVFVEAQGGDRRAVYDTELLPKAEILHPILAPADGFIDHIICDEVGICSLLLGGGRETLHSGIDLSVGLVLCKKAGDVVRKGDILAVIHANDEKKAQEAQKRYLAACRITQAPPEKRPLIKAIID